MTIEDELEYDIITDLRNVQHDLTYSTNIFFEVHLVTQGYLNNIVQDLNFLKKQAELRILG